MTEVHRVRSVRRWFVEAVAFYPRVALLGFRVLRGEGTSEAEDGVKLEQLCHWLDWRGTSGSPGKLCHAKGLCRFGKIKQR